MSQFSTLDLSCPVTNRNLYIKNERKLQISVKLRNCPRRKSLIETCLDDHL